jgi:type VI secretion system protein ImpE
MTASAIELVRHAKLQEAQDLLIAGVKRRPDDVDLRYNLAGVFAFAGDYDRALQHLDVIAHTKPELAPAIALYIGMLQAEEERRRAMEETHLPAIDVHGAGSTARRDLLVACRSGDAAAAARCMAALGPVGVDAKDGAGKVVVRDYDDVLGDVLEVFSAGRYVWMPLAALRKVEFAPATGLLDLLWAQCAIERRDGQKYTVHVPVLYAGSAASADPAVRCGRKTEWVDQCGVAFRGRGQRIFLFDGREVELLSLRVVEFLP